MKRGEVIFLAMVLAMVAGVAAAKDIMRPDFVTVSGRIVGYEPDSLVTAAVVEAEDILVRRGGKRIIPINADGTFSRTFWLPNAQMVSLKIYPMNSVGIYIEPGETLDIEVDYKALSHNSYRHLDNAVRFGGTLGQVNTELAAAPECHAILALNHDVDQRVTPQQFKDSVIRNYDRQNIEFERYIATLPANSKAPAILRSCALADAVGALSQYAQGNESHKFLPLEYYRDFTGALLHSDSTILVNHNAQILLSDLASSPLLPSNRYGIDLAELRQSVNFIKSKGGEFTAEELSDIYSNFDTISGSQVQYFGFRELVPFSNALYSAAERAGIRDEYSARRGKSLKIEDRMLAATHDSLVATNPEFLREFFGLEKLPVIWEYAVALRDLDKIMCSDTLDLDSHGITDPTLRARLESQHAALSSNSREVDESPALDYFNKLVEPFRGKYLYIDLWEMYCPPCRADIQGSFDFRRKYKDSPDFAIMFICSENGTSPDGWEKYSKEFMPDNVSLRLSRMHIDMLGELLNFNSVPYGVLVDPQGHILRTDFDYAQFRLFLQEKSFVDEQ